MDGKHKKASLGHLQQPVLHSHSVEIHSERTVGPLVVVVVVVVVVVGGN